MQRHSTSWAIYTPSGEMASQKMKKKLSSGISKQLSKDMLMHSIK